MYIEIPYQRRYEDFRKDGKMRLGAILKAFEATGCRHSDTVGDNILNDTKEGKAWIMTDWFVEIDQFPKVDQNIISRTWVEPIKQILFSNRDFEIEADGKVCARCVGRYVIVDLATGRPQKIGPEFADQYHPEDRQAIAMDKPPRLVTPEAFTNEVAINVRRSDIDYNDHVHNLTYLDYAFEALPHEVYKNYDFKGFRVTYKQAVKPHEQLVCKYACVEGKHICCIFDTAGELKTQIEFM